MDLHGYVDSDWASDIASCNSISFYQFMNCGGPMSWCSRLQEAVALSSFKFEYVSPSSCTKEPIRLRRLWNDTAVEINVRLNDSAKVLVESTSLNVENQERIYLARMGVEKKTYQAL